jgi:hypothetical protein
MPEVSREQTLRLCDLNLAAYLRHANTYAAGGEYRDQDGLLLFAGSHPTPHPYVNGLLRLSPAMSSAETLQRARDFFGERKRGFAVWIRDHADSDLESTVRAAGLWQRPPLEGQPGIFIDRPVPPAKTGGVEIRRVTTEQEARDYLHVVGEGWGMGGSPPELVWALFLTPEAVLAPQVLAFVAYLEGTPAGGCLAFVAHDVAGLYWAASTTAAKGRGLGTACFIAALNAGLDLGARVGSGQSSAKGIPIWRSLGFDVITHYRRYVSPPPR